MPKKGELLFGMHEEPGWVGGFTRQQDPLAQFPNGSRIEKAFSEENDTHAYGPLIDILNITTPTAHPEGQKEKRAQGVSASH